MSCKFEDDKKETFIRWEHSGNGIYWGKNKFLNFLLQSFETIYSLKSQIEIQTLTTFTTVTTHKISILAQWVLFQITYLNSAWIVFNS